MNLRPAEIALLLLVVLLLFGAKRLPDLARSMGRSLKIFKSEVTDPRDDGTTAASSGSASTAGPTEPAAVPDTRAAGTTPPHGDPALSALPADTSDRKQA
ncbi:Sec-independent protein translocase subunit TatA [Cellulomonas sp. ATA003]|uniref:Sec-independent protein translocase subunit TatA n=1 Tax=Cellulomonas sp. ATA003 TaxID=3073064 RepID=UPI002872B3B8|nr:Sec-independent protein translocase subunit TatA [Cellulomonas sp. ATA003]WNB84274.1 Sec-independent protein translocase subunit TatA [Cellulomonas sp. ATA003]